MSEKMEADTVRSGVAVTVEKTDASEKMGETVKAKETRFVECVKVGRQEGGQRVAPGCELPSERKAGCGHDCGQPRVLEGALPRHACM